MKRYFLTASSSDKKIEVDKDIYQEYKDTKLYLNSHNYALTKKDEFLHRLILGLTKDDKMTVDHIDGNPLNNKRNNLRVAHHSQNMANQKKRKNCKCQCKGVWEIRSKHTDVVKYEASITLNYKR